MDWLAFSLSNQQACFFEPFNPTPQHGTHSSPHYRFTNTDDAHMGRANASKFASSDRAEDEVASASSSAAPPQDLTTVAGSCPKLEDFLGASGEPMGRFSGEGAGGGAAYDSELKSIAVGFLRAAPPEEAPNMSKVVVAVEEEPKKAVDTFGQRTSIYRGVTRHRWTGRYEAHLWDNSCRREGQTRKGRQVYLGGYDKEEKAARAYDLAALKYWGPTTTTNFPVSNYKKELEEMKNMTRQEFVASLRRKSSGFSRGASIYRGVTRHHQHGRWQARIGRVAGNKDLYLGTFSTQEEAAEAYDIAAIKFRGPNAVTNFDISRYDVKSIMSSNLPIGGMSGRSSSKSADSPPSSSEAKQPLHLPAAYSSPHNLPVSALNLMLPYRQQPDPQRQHDYWSLMALHQQGHQSPYFNLFPPAVSVGNGGGYHPLGNVVTSVVPEHGSYNWGGGGSGDGGMAQQEQQSQSSSSTIPYATPIPLGSGYDSNNATATTTSATSYGGNWVTPSAAQVHPYHQPATIFGIE